MAEPVRLRLCRRKGFNLQAASRAANGLKAISVARPGKWGNPFVIAGDDTQDACATAYRRWLRAPGQRALRKAACAALRGRNLACWCAPGTPCHADILLALVNR